MERSEISIKALDRKRKSAKREAIVWLICAGLNIVPVVTGVIAGEYYNAFLHFTFVLLAIYVAICCNQHIKNIDIIIDCIKYNDECEVKYDHLFDLAKDCASKVGRATGVLTIARVFIKNSESPLTNAKDGLLEQIDECLGVNREEQIAEQFMRDMKNNRKESEQ